MILFTGSKASGRWVFTLRKLREAWLRGETTVLLTPLYFRFSNRD